ncbi:stage II sporulation protein R [Peribacillus glennii]|uniref:Stage II sporulation protein R n=1 Tax=Peribacillus glennii TaxID=2303991 RepID=A0A372LAB0_9BACI|nr:stage II sporulation protein R [Peribacillus glennii]RFU62336.1 stage II sporulation protein R [Peribacillus glennii]
MNKKYLSMVYLLILTIGTILSIYMPKVESAAKTDETVIIPKEAIRLRILANSDKKEDQDVKRLIRNEVNQNITGWVEDLTSLEEARKVIQSHLPDIQETAERIVEKQGVNQTVKVSFSKAKFPTKLYGQYLYPAGEYEAIVITLGEGEGANWWCVLFPPLCFLDFSNGTAVTKSPYQEEEENKIHQEQPNDVKDNFQEEEANEISRERQSEAKAELIKENETADKPVQDEQDEPVGNISEPEQAKSVETPGQMYVSQDESPAVVKSFFKELVADLF